MRTDPYNLTCILHTGLTLQLGRTRRRRHHLNLHQTKLSCRPSSLNSLSFLNQSRLLKLIPKASGADVEDQSWTYKIKHSEKMKYYRHLLKGWVCGFQNIHLAFQYLLHLHLHLSAMLADHNGRKSRGRQWSRGDFFGTMFSKTVMLQLVPTCLEGHPLKLGTAIGGSGRYNCNMCRVNIKQSKKDRYSHFKDM